MDLHDEEWQRKGATLSDKTARSEFGLTQDEIVAAIRAGKLQYRPSSMHGNPWLRARRTRGVFLRPGLPGWLARHAVWPHPFLLVYSCRTNGGASSRTPVRWPFCATILSSDDRDERGPAGRPSRRCPGPAGQAATDRYEAARAGGQVGRPDAGAGQDGRRAAAVRGHLGPARVAGATPGGGGNRQRMAG